MAYGITAGQAWFVRHQYLFEAPIVIYTNQSAYSKVCWKRGYDLVKYPQKFSDVYGKQIQKIVRKLRAYGFSENTLLSQKRTDNLDYFAEEDLNILKQKLILDKIAEQENLSRESVEWHDEYGILMSLAEVCQYIDDHADDLVRANYKAEDVLEKALQ